MGTLVIELDKLRAFFLRVTLSSKPIRKLFVRRSTRLFCFFTASLTLNFFASLAIPIWMLALGPVLLGIPHVFASIRYAPKIAVPNKYTDTKNLVRIIAFFVFMVSAVRGAETYTSYSLPRFFPIVDGWEWLVLLFVFSIAAVKFGKASLLKFGIFFIPLFLSAWKYPVYTGSFMLLGHNFIPFFYWAKSAKTKGELRVAIGSLILFSVLTTVLLIGLPHELTAFLKFPQPDLGDMFHPLILGQQAFPTSMNISLLQRGISALAFGQAVHYFLWLKVIPEQSTKQEAPLSFTQSKASLFKDFGSRLAGVVIFLSIAMTASIFIFDLGLLREFYLAIATAHGYIEIALLPLLWAKTPHDC